MLKFYKEVRGLRNKRHELFAQSKLLFRQVCDQDKKNPKSANADDRLSYADQLISTIQIFRRVTEMLASDWLEVRYRDIVFDKQLRAHGREVSRMMDHVLTLNQRALALRHSAIQQMHDDKVIPFRSAKL